MFQRTKICSGLLIAFGSSILAMPTAFAQDSSVQRVEITGSSIKQIDAETSEPVTILKADDMKKQGITTIDQILQTISSVQVSQGTSQVVGSGTAGASFADMRGIGANKTLILLNGRRIANNALDSSAPDMNMIPFAAIERVEVLRDGASSLYGTDAIGGVINFITRKDYKGGSITLGMDAPQHPGGASHSANIGFGLGDLDKDGINVFGFIDFSKTKDIGGTQRPYNTRLVGGLSPTTSPGNYYQDGAVGNPAAAAGCTAANLTADPTGSTSDCYETTSSFVDYTPAVQRLSGLLKASVKVNDFNTFGLETYVARDQVTSVIAPVPYGGLIMNKYRPDGTLNPYYPGNGLIADTVGLSSTYTEASMPAGAEAGFIHVKWRDLDNGSREDISTNTQDRLMATMEGTIADWDYNTAITQNDNYVAESLKGYSNGDIIAEGVLDGVINPFGAQSAAGAALIASAADSGVLQTAHGLVQSVDGHASHDLADWFHTGRPAAVALGFEARHERFEQVANTAFAEQVVDSTGFDPDTLNAGHRNIYAGFVELNVPILKSLDVTVAGRYDKYSDFGKTFNPKASFRFQPVKQFLLRGSFSTGFRAPSLYELNAAPTYTDTAGSYNDPVNCPNGTPITGKSSAANCQQQFQELNGGNPDLKPEKSKNATLGIVLEPVQDLSMEFDLWSISFDHEIGTIADSTVFADPTLYASVFHRNSAGDLSTDGSACPGANCGYLDLRTQNLGGVQTNGIDIAGSYKANMGHYGKLNLGLQSTWVHKYEYQTAVGGEWYQNVGVYSNGSPVFRWQHNAEVSWNIEPFSVGVAGHYKSGYIDEYVDTNAAGDVTHTKVSAYATFDLFGSYAAAKGYSVTAGVRNLFDRAPPYSNQDTTFQAGYDPRFTDPTGRTYYVRGTYSF